MADATAVSWCLEAGVWPGGHHPPTGRGGTGGSFGPHCDPGPKQAVGWWWRGRTWRSTSLSSSSHWWVANQNGALPTTHTLGLIASVTATLRHMTTIVKTVFCYFGFGGLRRGERRSKSHEGRNRKKSEEGKL